MKEFVQNVQKWANFLCFLENSIYIAYILRPIGVMVALFPKLSWCIVRLGRDYNWWVKEVSEEIHWDVHNLGILDPKQMEHVLELIEPLNPYGFNPDSWNEAFFRFKIDKRLTGNCVRLIRTQQSFLDREEPLFALPNKTDDEKSPYADFIDAITKLRARWLNHTIHFQEKLSAEEITDELTEKYHSEYFEGIHIHVYRELTDILEYIPAGFTPNEEKDEGDTFDVQEQNSGTDELISNLDVDDSL